MKDKIFPKNTTLGAIKRDERIIIPKGEDFIKEQDKLIIFTLRDSIKEIEKLLA